MHETLHDVLIFLAAAVVVVPLVQRLKASPVLGYLLAGVAIGPEALDLIHADEGTLALADLGVAFLLFTIGLELSLDRIWTMRRYILGLGLAQVALTSLTIGLAAAAMGLAAPAAVVVGGALALSSTAFVLRMLVDAGEQATRYGRVAVAILLLQDLAVVPLLTLIPLLAAPDASLPVALALAAGKAALAVAAILLVGRLLLRPLFRAVAVGRTPELLAALALLLVLGVGVVTSAAGLSMALGAFLAGLLIAETEFRHQVEADIRPFHSLLLGLFFMTVGLLLDLGVVFAEWRTVLLATVGLLAVKAALIAGLVRGFALPWSVAVRSGLLLAQGGEFAFILLGRATAEGVLEPLVAQTLTATVTLSMLATPGLAWAGGRAYRVLEGRDAVRPSGGDPELRELEGHVIVAGFGRVGRAVAQLLSAHGLHYVALDLDVQHVAAARRQGLPVYYGDAARAEVLQAVRVDHASALVVTLDRSAAVQHLVAVLRARHPDLKLVARARDRAHARLLEGAGADAVVLEAAEASLQMGALLLQEIGHAAEAVGATVEDFRRDGYRRMDERPSADEPPESAERPPAGRPGA